MHNGISIPARGTEMLPATAGSISFAKSLTFLCNYEDTLSRLSLQGMESRQILKQCVQLMFVVNCIL